jgi:hypothetical protein
MRHRTRKIWGCYVVSPIVTISHCIAALTPHAPDSVATCKEGAPPMLAERPVPIIDRDPLDADQPRPAAASRYPANPSLARAISAEGLPVGTAHRGCGADRDQFDAPYAAASDSCRALRALTAFAAGGRCWSGGQILAMTFRHLVQCRAVLGQARPAPGGRPGYDSSRDHAFNGCLRAVRRSRWERVAVCRAASPRPSRYKNGISCAIIQPRGVRPTAWTGGN